jgi:hypothetical protein
MQLRWVTAQPVPQHAGVAHSQPSSAVGAVGLLQLLKPALHVDSHLPAVHVAAATCTEEQARPQSPHAVVAVLMFVSHPPRSGAVVVQFLKPALHPE